MDAKKALIDYGFSDEGGAFVISRGGKLRDKYESVPGGFHRFRREDGEWRQYPFSIHKDWEGIGGMAFDAKQKAEMGGVVKPECFEWVYPEEWIVREYTAGLAAKNAALAEHAARHAGG